MTLGTHPMSLMRPQIRGEQADSRSLRQLPNNSRVEVAGMVIARQRPATAKGILFMLLEDEWGTINLIVPPPVYDRHRMVARVAAFVQVAGRLERRDANMNVLVDRLEQLDRPDLPLADVHPHRAARAPGDSGHRRDRSRPAGCPQLWPPRPMTPKPA